MTRKNLLGGFGYFGHEKLREGWLYWPSKHQPDPRITMYDSKGLKEIEEMAREALKGTSDETDTKRGE